MKIPEAPKSAFLLNWLTCCLDTIIFLGRHPNKHSVYKECYPNSEETFISHNQDSQIKNKNQRLAKEYLK